MTDFIPVPYDLLVEVVDYLDDRADVIDGPEGPRPNRAMQLHHELDVLLEKSGR